MEIWLFIGAECRATVRNKKRERARRESESVIAFEGAGPTHVTRRDKLNGIYGTDEIAYAG